MRSTTYLADTNILSELFKPRPDAGVVAWAEGVPLLFVSTITVEELFFGLAWKPNPTVREQLEEFFDTFCEFLPVDEAVSRHAGHLRGELQLQGISGSQADILIASTAVVHGLTVATRNVRDFKECRVPLLNPFRA